MLAREAREEKEKKKKKSTDLAGVMEVEPENRNSAMSYMRVVTWVEWLKFGLRITSKRRTKKKERKEVKCQPGEKGRANQGILTGNLHGLHGAVRACKVV